MKTITYRKIGAAIITALLISVSFLTLLEGFLTPTPAWDRLFHRTFTFSGLATVVMWLAAAFIVATNLIFYKPPFIKCAHCGNEVSMDSQYCKSCGSDLE